MFTGKKKAFDLLVATLEEYEGHTNKFVQEALKKHVRNSRKFILKHFLKSSLPCHSLMWRFEFEIAWKHMCKMAAHVR